MGTSNNAGATKPTKSRSPSGTPNGKNELVIGLDIGGSKTHGVLWGRGLIMSETWAGSANVQNVTQDNAVRNLAGLFGALLKYEDPNQVKRAVVGSGGIDTLKDAGRLRKLIAVHLPHAAIDVVHDTRLILAAAGIHTGIALIAGTGSAAWGIRADGREARSGGWGHLLGDEGGGYQVAREAVRRALYRRDLGLHPDELDTLMLELNQVNTVAELISLFHGGTSRTYWAAQAGAVFDAGRNGHPGAKVIIKQAATDLTRLALSVVARIGSAEPVVLGGGLAMHEPELRTQIRANLATAGVTNFLSLAKDPVMGVPFLIESGQPGFVNSLT